MLSDISSQPQEHTQPNPTSTGTPIRIQQEQQATQPNETNQATQPKQPKQPKQSVSKMGEFFRQFKLLFRNIVLNKRGSWKMTTLEVFLPLYPVILLTFILSLDIIPYSFTIDDAVLPLAPASIASSFNAAAFQPILGFAPMSDPLAVEAAKKVCDRLGMDFENITQIQESADVASYWDKGGAADAGLGAAMVFGRTTDPDFDPSVLTFTIVKADTSAFVALSTLADNVNKTTDEELLLQFGYVALQQAGLEVLYNSDNAIEFNLATQRFPVPAGETKRNFLVFSLPLFFLTALFINLQATLTTVGAEMERGIRETLFVKGMKVAPYWWAWFAASSLFTIAGAFTIVIGINIAGLFGSTNMFHLLTVFCLYGLAQSAFSLVVASSIGEYVKGQTLFIIGAMFLILSQGLFFLVQLVVIDAATTPSTFVVAVCFLFYPAPFAHVLWTLSDSDLEGRSFSDDDSPFISLAFIMLFVDIVLYFGIALLVDMRRQSRRSRPGSGGNAVAPGASANASENAGIRCDNLVKEFKGKNGLEYLQFWKPAEHVKAVDGLTLQVPPKQIFCLLGHNGAGKTTAINMLKGANPPTSGSAWIHGMHVVADRKQLRQSLGVCPQFDVNYDHTTVRQQLLLYGAMTGMTEQKAVEETIQLLTDLHLIDKADELAGRLSGGQKRRLSLAVALIGSPSVVLLDEPTTGLDPKNRQGVWAVLNRIKNETTILITTHSMEEADVLGDTIGIMSKGKLQAIGTSLDLKEKYGVGYHLHCVRSSDVVSSGGPEDSATTDENDVAALKSLIDSCVVGAGVLSNVGTEVSFSLPQTQSHKFPALFSALDINLSSVGILSYGLSPTTLEDVFLNLAAEGGEHSEVIPGETTASIVTENSLKKESGDHGNHAIKPLEHMVFPTFKCKLSRSRQVYSVLVSVFTHAFRDPGVFGFLIIWPIIIGIITGTVNNLVKVADPTEVVLNDARFFGSIYDSVKGLGDAALPYAFTDDSVSVNETVSQFAGYLTDSALPAVEDVFELLRNTSDSDDQVRGAILFGPWESSPVSPSSFDATLVFNQNKNSASARFLTLLAYDSVLPDGIPNDAVSYLDFKAAIRANDFSSGGLLFFVANALALLSAMYTLEMVKSRFTRMKGMMLVASLSRPLYWLSHGIAHGGLFVVGASVAFSVMAAMGMDGATQNTFLAFVVVFVVYAPAGVLYGYCYSFLANAPKDAEEFVHESQSLLILIPWLLVTFAGGEDNELVQNIILPTFIPGFGLYRALAILETAGKEGTGFTASDIFVWDRQLAQVLLGFACSAMWYLILLYVLDTALVSRMYRKLSNHLKGIDNTVNDTNDYHNTPAIENAGDGGVDASGLPEPVSALPPGFDTEEKRAKLPLYAHDMRKSFALKNKKGKVFRAVKGVDLGVQKGNVFGLLGPNGAGKSTTFKCMGAEEGQRLDSGDCYIMGKSVVSHLGEARKHMGVCAQFDAISHMHTCREQLRLFARLRGVPKEDVEPVIDFFIDALDLRPKANTKAGKLSGGNKRRLSVALAMIGNPDVVFLDEPSTGMDPATRRHLWNFLSAARKDRAIVLTTHSMEEADALCSRIAIMVQGAIRTVGTAQELKSKHGTNYVLTCRLSDSVATDPAALKKIDDLVKSIDSGATLSEEHNVNISIIRYTLPSSVGLGPIFEAVNANKEKLGLDDFSVAQSSLEDAFIALANKQLSMD